MICPKCNKQGFSQKEVWYPDNMLSTLKCKRCGERSNLGDWLVLIPVSYASVRVFKGEAIPVRMPG